MEPSFSSIEESLPQYETSPSPAEQLSAIEPLVNSALQIGEIRYLIDLKWYDGWHRFATLDSSNSPGPIDNTSLFKDNSFLVLRDWLSIDIDVIPVPEEAWEKLVLWYGSLTPEISRPVIKGSAQDAIVEVYPWEVRLVRILPPNSSGVGKESSKLQISKGCTISDLRNKVIDALDIGYELKLWKFGEDVLETEFITADQLEYAQLIGDEFDSKTIQEFGLHLYDSIGVETQNDGMWPTESVIKSEVSSPSNAFSISPSYAPKTTTLGVTGLSNLGNTCFMNSALQCLSNTQELKEYFISGLYKRELNRTNPLGMNGEVAKAFGSLIEKLWSGQSSSITPRDFKLTIGQFAPSFMGYQQHDSQEFIAFLLDGLHEDLNRIYDKPFIEKKDSDGRPDALIAEEHWKIHKARNDSIIVDMFHGQYKSTLICPECNKISVTFDPFMYLTLPIPISKELKLEVHFIPLDSSKCPIKLNLTMPHESTHRTMKEKIGSIVNVPSGNLLSCEIYTSRIYKVFENSEKLDEIGASDTIYVYELPVSFPPDRNSGYVILPVLNAYSISDSAASFLHSRSISDFFGFPLIVTLSESQISVNGLEEAVLDQLNRYTTVDLKSLEPSKFHSPKLEDLINNVEMNDLESDEEVVAEEEDSVPQEESAPEVSVEESKPMDTKLFSMKISSQISPLGIPDNFTMGDFISLSQRKQAVDEAKNDNHYVPLLDFGDTIICEWDREVAGYVFNDNRDAMDTDDVGHGLWDVFESYQDFVEEAPTKKEITLDDCLDEFIKEEQLGEDDLWYCPNCKKHQQALKKFDLWRLPDFLVVHLKRFSHTRSWRNKIDALVDFPISGLDLSSRVLSEHIGADGLVYDLYAISNHYGGLGGGHYTAYGYNHEQWYHYDDSIVEPVDEDSVKTTAAYLLFYKRRNAKLHLPELEHTSSPNIEVDRLSMEHISPDPNVEIVDSDEELDRFMSDNRSSPDFM